MKPFTLIAALPFLALMPLASAATTEADLKRLCAEQERQIRALELENSRLRSLTRTATETPPVKKAEAKASAPKVENAPKATKRFYTVKSGDTLSRIARKHETTPEVLAKLNKLKDAGLIRLGQKLELPAKAQPVAKATPPKQEQAPAKPAPASAAPSHSVKAGETFFSIARVNEISVQDLAEANPSVNPRSLRVGQTLSLQTKAFNKSAETAKTELGATEAPAQPNTTQILNKPIVRSVKIDEEISFGDFAKSHGMEPAKINALNGLHLESNTVLAQGSELYVSAQP